MAKAGSKSRSGRRPDGAAGRACADLLSFRAPFDGSTEATLGKRVARSRLAENVAYRSSVHSQALEVGKGTHVRYALGRSFPSESGALEVRFRPDFPQTCEQPERTVLRLKGRSGCSVTLSFQPIGYAWEFLVRRGQKTRSLRAWYGKAAQGRWHHLLLAWDVRGRPHPWLKLYLNGQPSGQALLDFSLSGITDLSIGGRHDSQVAVDEVAVYKRAVSETQARFLSGSFKKQEGRFSDLAERMTRDERRSAEHDTRRRRRVKKLEGRIGNLLQLRGHRPQKVGFPEGITATAIRPEDVCEIDLDRFDVIHFPGGGNYQLTDEEKKRIAKYVEDGGGYVGVCMGAYSAHKFGIMDFDCHTFYEHGLIRVKLAKHPVTSGYGDQIVMQHGWGPIMVPRKGCEVVGAYDMGDPDQPQGAIIAGTHGKGRAVLFGPHPQGGGVSAHGKGISFSGEDLDTNRLLVNAFLWAARIR